MLHIPVYLNTRISDHVKYSHDTRFRESWMKKYHIQISKYKLKSERVLNEREGSRSHLVLKC